MPDFDGLISDNEYKIIVNSAQSGVNLDRSCVVSDQEISTILKSRALRYIHENPDCNLVEVLNYCAELRQNLSMSRRSGKSSIGYEFLKGIFTRELSKKDVKNDKDKEKIELGG